MSDIELFQKKLSPSLADQSIVRFDDEGNPLKTQFREAPREEASPLSIIPRIGNDADVVRTKVRELLPSPEEIPMPNYQVLSRESHKIIQLPPARISVGGVSQRAYEKKYGLRESGRHRFFRKNLKEPIRNGLMKSGDFLVKAYGQSYLDRFDILRLKFSDKNNNYSRGIIPKPLRTPISLFGTPAMGNIPSLLLQNNFLGRRVTSYREGRRARIDKMKTWISKPFRRGATTVSSHLPLHESRYKFSQKVRGVNEWISKGEQYAKSLIDGGMSGVLARRRQKKLLRERRARLRDSAKKRESRR